MFSFFGKNKKAQCPIDEDGRLWMEHTFRWLSRSLGEEYIKSKKLLLPNNKDFPIQFDRSESSAHEALKVIAAQMDIDYKEIELTFYDQSTQEFSGGMGHKILTQPDVSEKGSAGVYHGINERNKYQISLETSQLKDPENLIATLAHEMSHIKLLDKLKVENADEYLTDLLPLFFGLGIFMANASFRFYKNSDSWGYSAQGYLTEMAWSYALALYAYIRKERSPEWIRFLTANIKSDFKKGEKFIYQNEEIILKQPYKKPTDF